MIGCKPTEEKIAEIRKKAKRGRQKGYTHSEATKEKIRKGMERVRKPVSEFSEEDRMKPLKLEEVLKLARQEAEENCEKHNIDLQGRSVRTMEIFALDNDQEWICNFWEFGLEDAFKRVREMLGWERSRVVVLRGYYEEKTKEPKRLTAIKKIDDEGNYWLW